MGRLNFQFSNNVDNDDVHFHVKWGLWCDIKPWCSRHDQKIRYFGLKRNFLLHNWTIVILLIAKPCLQAYPASRVKGSFKSCSWFAWKWRQNFNQFFALLLRSAKNSLKTISLQTGCCWVELSFSMRTGSGGITVQPTSVLTKAFVWYEIKVLWVNINHIRPWLSVFKHIWIRSFKWGTVNSCRSRGCKHIRGQS